MQFIVIGRDGTDEKALDRRMAAREAHLATAKQMHDTGRWLYAAAILNEDGKMAGSVIVCDFESEAALRSQWLDNEAYVKGNVWETVEVTRAAVAPFWAPKQ
ncbi:MAG TPA: hypothetical protein DHV36_05505 [Desulfobacteraceae bacterium]|nr:hypothetical protein [Desulfobacteraceae bacterium]